MRKFKVYVSEYLRHETEVIVLAEDEDSLNEILNGVGKKNDAYDYILELGKQLKAKGCKILSYEEDHRIEPTDEAECTDSFEDNGKEMKPYLEEDYDEAKERGLNLDDWDDYKKFYGLVEA